MIQAVACEALARPNYIGYYYDPKKIDRLKTWCEDASETTGKSWDYLYVKQEIWDQIKITPNSFKEIINVFKK